MPASHRIDVVGLSSLAFLLSAAAAPLAHAEVPARGPEPFAAAALLPERTLAVVVAEDIAATAERFRETNVYKLWREQEVQDFLKPLTEGFEKLYRKGEELGEFSFADILNALRGQVTLAAVGAKVIERGRFLPEVAFLAGVADRAAAERLVARFARAVKEAGGPEMQTMRFGPVTIGRLFREGNRLELDCVLTPRALCVTLGPGGEVLSEIASAAWGRPAGATLDKDEDLLLALGKAGDRRDLFAYAAYARVWERFHEIVERRRGKEPAESIARLHSALGLDGLRGISFAEAVDAPGFRTQAYVQAPGTSEGLFNLISKEVISRGLLDLAPAGSSFLAAARLRPDRLLPLARQVAEALGAGAQEKLDRFVSIVRDTLGVDIEREVLGALGGEVMIFGTPVAAAGLGPVARMAGLALLVPTAEPDAFGAVYEKLVEVVTALAVVRGTDILEETTPEGAVVRYVEGRLGTTPSVTYFNGHLVAGLAKKAVAAACASLAEGAAGEPFTSSAEYEKALARAGVMPGFFLGYQAAITVEELAQPLSMLPMAKVPLLRRTARRGVPKEIHEIAKMMNLAEPPSARTFASYSVPQISVGWRDADGLGLTCWSATGVITPATVTAAVGAAFAGPYAERAKERAERRRCMANLRMVGIALRGYAAEHGEQFPAKLENLVPKYLPTEVVIACPATGKRYAYVSGLKSTDAPSLIVAYELPEGHQGGLNVLNVGGKVMWRRNITWIERRVESQVRRMRAEGRRPEVIGGMQAAPSASEEAVEEEFF